MAARSPVRVVGISGPDGAGKTTTARALASELRRRGHPVREIYLYGCFFCRRLPSGLRTANGHADGHAERGNAVWRAARGTHAMIDALELTARLWVATRAPFQPPFVTGAAADSVVVTDRSPVDGLAKHGPESNTLSAKMFDSALGRYDVVFYLDAPASVLAQRDGEHSPDELDAARRRFDRWLPRFADVVRRIDVGDREAESVVSTLAAASRFRRISGQKA